MVFKNYNFNRFLSSTEYKMHLLARTIVSDNMDNMDIGTVYGKMCLKEFAIDITFSKMQDEKYSESITKMNKKYHKMNIKGT